MTDHEQVARDGRRRSSASSGPSTSSSTTRATPAHSTTRWSACRRSGRRHRRPGQPWIAVNLIGVMAVTHAVVGGMVERGRGPHRHGHLRRRPRRRGRPRRLLGREGGCRRASCAAWRRRSRRMASPRTASRSAACAHRRSSRCSRDEALAKRIVRAYPLGRLGEPEDPAALITFLASDAASWITAQTYPVNGGFSAALCGTRGAAMNLTDIVRAARAGSPRAAGRAVRRSHADLRRAVRALLPAGQRTRRSGHRAG